MKYGDTFTRKQSNKYKQEEMFVVNNNVNGDKANVQILFKYD